MLPAEVRLRQVQHEEREDENPVVVLEDAIYPATFLDPEETVANALRLLKKSRKPMAIVRDEAGTVRGMITLEDVLEEIVGDIEDEHDRPMAKARVRRRKKIATPEPAKNTKLGR